MSKMIIARGPLLEDRPRTYLTDVPSDTYVAFKTDKAWTGVSFGEKVLVVALPGKDADKATEIWCDIRVMIAKSPKLFDAMARVRKRYVPE